MPSVLATLPLHLALQLTITGYYSLENITLPAEKPLSQLPDGYTAFPDIGVAMKYYRHKLPWNLARKHCILDGGLPVNFIPWTVDANRTAPAPYSCAVLWGTEGGRVGAENCNSPRPLTCEIPLIQDQNSGSQLLPTSTEKLSQQNDSVDLVSN